MDPLLEAYLGRDFRKNGFNVEAALVPFWPALRRMVILQLGSMMLFGFLWLIFAGGFLRFNPAGGLILAVAAMSILHGAGGNNLMWRAANRAKARALNNGLEGDAAIDYMRREGRPSWIGLGVAGVLGIGLFVYLLPAFTPHPDTHMLDQYVRADLRSLMTAQQQFHDSSGVYSRSFDSLGFLTSTGVTIDVTSADSTGWSARGFHARNARQRCFIYVGTGVQAIRGLNEFEPKCVRAGSGDHR